MSNKTQTTLDKQERVLISSLPTEKRREQKKPIDTTKKFTEKDATKQH